MLEARQIPDTNILEIRNDGPITRDQFDRLTELGDRMIAAHGSIRILEIVEDIGKIEPSAIWADLRWGTTRLKHLSHAAIVADAGWIERATALLKPFFSIEMRHFSHAQRDEALHWLRTAPNPRD